MRAAALIDLKRPADAQPLLDDIGKRFHDVGDVRRESAALMLKGSAAATSGDDTEALRIYRECLERFRQLKYVAARELVLFSLRALRRERGPGELSNAISAILAAEPEKRYVARFPRRQLPLLRVLSVIALPLALLMMALVAPQQSIAQIAQLASFQLTIDLGRSLLVFLILLLAYSGVFALIATAVIAFVPLGDLDREQPDYFVTDPHGIARYDFRGAQAQLLEWSEIRRWLRVERQLWALPVSLVSGAFLEARSGEDMQIDGIISWFAHLQEDIDLHLQQANNPVQAEDYGFHVLYSWSGLSAVVGLVSLALFIFSQNSWAEWLIRLLPPEVYAVLSLVAFSGLLILVPTAYWLALNPLSFRRVLGIRDYYPFAAAATGALLMITGLFQIVPRVPPLNFGLALTGALVLGYALAVIVDAPTRLTRWVVAGAVLLVSIVAVALNTIPLFNLVVSQAGADRAVLSAASASRASSAQASIDAGAQILADPEASPIVKAQALANAGRAYYAVGDWRNAVDAYTSAMQIYEQLPDSPEKQQALAALHYNRYRALRDSGGDGWSTDLKTACGLAPDVGPDCAQ